MNTRLVVLGLAAMTLTVFAENAGYLGIVLVNKDKNKPQTIGGTIPGSPAEKAGIKPGCFLISVDGTNVVGMSSEEWVNLIRGDAGTEVTLGLADPGMTQTNMVCLKRDKAPVSRNVGTLPAPEVPAGMKTPPPGVAVRFMGFTNNASGGAGMLFRFTNGSQRDILYAVQPPEYKTEDGWQLMPLPSNAMPTFGTLVPSQSVVGSLPVHSTNFLWRIKVSCTEQTTRWQRILVRGRFIITGQKTGPIGGRKYIVTSPASDN